MNNDDLDISYTTKQGYSAIFSWDFFLQTVDSEYNEDWYEAQQLAAEWVTCAVGNQCAVIPRGPHGAPLDKKLAELGVAFNEAVSVMDKHEAIKLLEQIEQRSDYLLHQPRYVDPTQLHLLSE